MPVPVKPSPPVSKRNFQQEGACVVITTTANARELLNKVNISRKTIPDETNPDFRSGQYKLTISSMAFASSSPELMYNSATSNPRTHTNAVLVCT